jgi:transcriptional regulator with XRE-family HTH domain
MRSYIVDGARVGQARQALRNDQGKPMKQVEAAEALGIHAVTLNRIENGKAPVSLELLERLVELTGRSREWLLGQDDQVDPILANRDRIARALAKIAEGFEELELVDVLNTQARLAAVEIPDDALEVLQP